MLMLAANGKSSRVRPITPSSTRGRTASGNLDSHGPRRLTALDRVVCLWRSKFKPSSVIFECSFMLMLHRHPALQFSHPLPYGAILHDHGVQFVVFSRSATGMRVLLYDKVEDREPSEVIVFDKNTDRWGDIWSIVVPGIGAGQLYHCLLYTSPSPRD